MADYKQVIIVRMDLGLPRGKICSQVGHACVEAVLRSDIKIVKKWRSSGMAKIVVKVKNLRELRKYERLAKQVGLVTAVITDAGRTIVSPGTVTCMGVGPAPEKEIDKITSELKLL